MADDADTEQVTFTVANPRTINSKRLYVRIPTKSAGDSGLMSATHSD